MQELLQGLFIALPILYWLSFFLAFFYFLRQNKTLGKWASLTLSLGLIAHLTFIALKVFVAKESLLLERFEIFSMMALAMGLIYVVIEIFTKVKSTAFFFLFLVALFQAISFIMAGQTHQLPDVFYGKLLFYHTTLVIIGYSAFFIAAIYALLYLILHFNLKKSNFGLFFSRLPPLQSILNMHNKAVVLGLVFAGISIILGIHLKIQKFDKVFLLDPKIVLSIVVWLLYFLIALANRYFHWSKVLLASYTLIGFLLIIFSMLIIRLIPASFHRFG